MVGRLNLRARTALLAALSIGAAACSSSAGDAKPEVTRASAPETAAEPSTAPAAPSTAATTTEPTASTEPSTPTTTSPPTTPPTVPSTQPSAPVLEVGPTVVSGPVTGGNGEANGAKNLDSFDYGEAEFFISGDATRFTPVGAHGSDGMWDIAPGATAPFVSRMIVRTPKQQADFSGVVLVEWLNVSGGADSDPDWGYNSEEIMRSGHIWVGVSAQAVGVQGGQSALGAQANGLKDADPARYGTLTHPGDAFSFDIYSHATRALTNRDGVDPLGSYVPTSIIGIGESQSATFLTTYINAVQPKFRLFDGFLVHSRLGAVPSIDNPALRGPTNAAPIIRTDLDVPTMIFSTETDLTVLGNARTRQDDSPTIRLWEVAGTAHADEYLLTKVYGTGDGGSVAICPKPINSGPQHQVLKAALHHLVEWVTNGTEPPTAPRIDVEIEGANDPVIVRDAKGNAVGGIRTPAVDVPISSLSGDPMKDGPGWCFLFGTTVAFDTATLAQLYPTHQAYVDAFTKSTEAAVAQGYILRPEADAMIADAAASDIGK